MWKCSIGRAHHARRSYSPQMRTNSSRWCGPRMEESRVRYSKLSMITATNRFSIYKKIERHEKKSSRNTDKTHRRRVKVDESWPGRSWRRWMRRSSSKRSRSHSRLSGPETWWGGRWRGPVHTPDLTDMKAWSPARTPLSHSWWFKNNHKDRAETVGAIGVCCLYMEAAICAQHLSPRKNCPYGDKYVVTYRIADEIKFKWKLKTSGLNDVLW